MTEVAKKDIICYNTQNNINIMSIEQRPSLTQSQEKQQITNDIQGRMQEANISLTPENTEKIQALDLLAIKDLYIKIDTIVQMCMNRNMEISQAETQEITRILEWHINTSNGKL